MCDMCIIYRDAYYNKAENMGFVFLFPEKGDNKWAMPKP